ncbi:MAG TPA: alpha/beta fold hydrolase [Gemmatimonadaceae bacterium]|nr:alpha/beta fold hydrolase [Gemmatimonadaceae bacterium]
MVIPALVVALVLGGVWFVARARRALAVERELAIRLPVGDDGFVIDGGPIRLEGAGRNRAVLLLHGFGDTPQTLEYLAGRLRADDWNVVAPALPGHARTIREFARSTADDWLAAARREFEALRLTHDEVAVVGLSMGGALASVLAADDTTLPALVLLAPYLAMSRRVRRFSRLHALLALWRAYVFGRSVRSIRDPLERSRNRAYGYTPPATLHELWRVVRWARGAAPRIVAPTLVIVSRQDNRIASPDAEAAFGLIGSPEKRIVWIEGAGHVITVDYGRDEVIEQTRDWLRRHSAQGERRQS